MTQPVAVDRVTRFLSRASFFFVEASGCMGFEPLAQRKSAGHAYVGESL